MSEGGYNGLKAFAFTVGVTVLIFVVLYAAKRYNPGLFGQEAFSRHYSWYLSGPNDPPGTGSDSSRWSFGEKPRMWDVWIASWYPPCSQPESRSERLGLGEGKGKDEKRDVDCEINDEKRPGWAEFLPLSADKVSDADTTGSSPRAKASNPVQSTSSTQIYISTIILMPTPPRPTSLPSTSSPKPPFYDTYDPPREYALGTSYIPSTPDG